PLKAVRKPRVQIWNIHDFTCNDSLRSTSTSLSKHSRPYWWQTDCVKPGGEGGTSPAGTAGDQTNDEYTRKKIPLMKARTSRRFATSIDSACSPHPPCPDNPSAAGLLARCRSAINSRGTSAR